eukprot:TRINITY_DN29006_c0_g1_i1.p1 TRINITY_DN29006_c0_g1~~TRINITY_DN29006_c0_g1_i1.p1  ORF type:complete len:1093 (+),score=214.17 TRINITY_DN29006_c0_g1_i1:73-3351(+)
MVFKLSVALIAVLAHTSGGSRVLDWEARRGAGLSIDTDLQCCCKQDKCEADAKPGADEAPAVYSPDANLCCKMKTYSCRSMLQFSGYSQFAPSTDYCRAPQHSYYIPPADDDLVDDDSAAAPLTPGSPGHTVHNFCELGTPGLGETETSSPGTKAQNNIKNSIVKALVKELNSNSLDKMAKEIFSLYVCVRWAPSTSFLRVAEGEIATGQLSNRSSVFEHYKASSFVPMRCSKNINVYGNAEKDGTQFETFEKDAVSLAQWYDAEGEGAVAKRLQKIQRRRTKMDQLDGMSKAFDLEYVESKVQKCPEVTQPMLVNTFTASTDELLNDCAAATWWLAKLRSWHQAMPFVSFISPTAEAIRNSRPSSKEQALVCFGKRVASQLHRRQDGDHLLADQSMVGCHGFWDLGTAATMLNRIVRLWRPPTCQLAAMELNLKMKIMEVIADMNSNLFDALPAMLLEEMDDADSDNKTLKAEHGLGIVGGLLNSVASSFKSLRGNYVRLGQMLGNTVVKWVVCPLKPIESQAKRDELDAALGTEDDVSRYYAQIAYSEWTGKADLLPGEDCPPYQGDPQMHAKGLLQCSLGVMQEDMPEPYRNEKFICPVRPFLPAKQQLEVLRKKHDLCVVHMSQPQMDKAHWLYRGRTPQKKQYDVVENLPTADLQYMKIVDFHTLPDTEFHLWRTFVTIGNGCTQEEVAATPRWCSKPDVANEPSLASDLLNGAVAVGGAAGNLVTGGLEAAGVIQKRPSNHMSKESVGKWIWGAMKNMEKTVRDTTDSFLGRSASRYDKLYKRMFSEIEAAELLHSSSFQAKLDNTGSDSKKRQKFERFALVAPCTDFNPQREFALRYRWTERALSVARKGQQRFGSGLLSNAGAFRVQLRGAGTLHMKDEGHAWLSYAAHIRAASVGAEFASWIKTSNPFLMELTGTYDAPSDARIRADSLQGFEVVFACGTRKQMHDLPLDFQTLPGSFATCVRNGPEKNDHLRKETGSRQPFLKDEVVVRATFRSLPSCHHEAEYTRVKNENESVNPVVKNFFGFKGCRSIREPIAGPLPEDLESSTRQDTYRGMLLGSGLPTETLTEVLIDPADFLGEVDMK